jgi:hypothetical protein
MYCVECRSWLMCWLKKDWLFESRRTCWNVNIPSQFVFSTYDWFDLRPGVQNVSCSKSRSACLPKHSDAVTHCKWFFEKKHVRVLVWHRPLEVFPIYSAFYWLIYQIFVLQTHGDMQHCKLWGDIALLLCMAQFSFVDTNYHFDGNFCFHLQGRSLLYCPDIILLPVLQMYLCIEVVFLQQFCFQNSAFIFVSSELQTRTFTSRYIYIYIYVCVCVCVCN